VLFMCRNAFYEVLPLKENKLVRSNSLAAMCIIIVSIVCVFSSISMAGYWVDFGRKSVHLDPEQRQYSFRLDWPLWLLRIRFRF
jgi:hypothetical protein